MVFAMTLVAIVGLLLRLSGVAELPTGIAVIRTTVESVEQALKPGTAVPLSVVVVVLPLVGWVAVAARGTVARRTLASVGAVALVVTAIGADALRDAFQRIGSHGIVVIVPPGSKLRPLPPGQHRSAASKWAHPTQEARDVTGVADRAFAAASNGSQVGTSSSVGAKEACFCGGRRTVVYSTPISQSTYGEETGTADVSMSTSTNVSTSTSTNVSTSSTANVSTDSTAALINVQSDPSNVAIPPSLAPTISQSIATAVAAANTAASAANRAAALASASASAGGY